MRTIIPAEENPILRMIARDISVDEINTPVFQKLIADMKFLLSKEKYGVAIAASQVGEPLRLFIVSGRALTKDANKETGDDTHSVPTIPDQVYINPILTKMSRGRKEKHEGCLSVKGKWGMVPRAQKATVTALNENGQKFTRGASGFLAHIFQHEMDHLDGVLYTDKATELFDDKPEDEHE